MQKRIMAGDRSHKEEYTGTQTEPTNDEGDSKKNQTCSVSLIDKGMGNVGVFLSVRLSAGSPCQM